MAVILVPFVQFAEDGEKKGVYTGIYNLDITHIRSIEPDKDGDTVIYHRFGPTITIKIPCEDMLLYLGRTIAVDISLIDYVKKHDDKIEGFILDNTQKEEEGV